MARRFKRFAVACLAVISLIAPATQAVPIAASVALPDADASAALTEMQLSQTESALETQAESLNQGLYLGQEEVLDILEDAPKGEEVGLKPQRLMQLSAEPLVDTSLSDENKLAQTDAAVLTDGTTSETETVPAETATLPNTMDRVKFASQQAYDYVTKLSVADMSTPVNDAHAMLLFVFSIATIVGCCASTTICVRAARDSNIAMNALSIRRKYHRNMQLYMLVKEKMLVDKHADRLANGHCSQNSESRSLTDSEQDSSFASTSNDASRSYDQSNLGGAAGLMHPSDMILEQSNDDDESFVDQRPRRGMDLLGGAENMSLIEEDYIIVDPITESYRQQNVSSNRRSFFEESLIATERSSPLTGNSSAQNESPAVQSSPEVNVHVSQLSGAGLTDCSEDEKEDEHSFVSQSSEEHFDVGPMTDAE